MINFSASWTKYMEFQNRFTGWYDVELSDTGLSEAKKAGELWQKKILELISLIPLI